MYCKTCHHEHKQDQDAGKDDRPYSDPMFCIARLSEKLSAADLQIETLKKERDDWKQRHSDMLTTADKLHQEKHEMNRLIESQQKKLKDVEREGCTSRACWGSGIERQHSLQCPLGIVAHLSHPTCCLYCQRDKKDCATCHCHVAKPDEEQQTEERL